MNNKLKSKLMPCILLMLFINLAACGKYEEGPSLSLRTKKARLVGSWELDEVNGRNATSGNVRFQDDGDFLLTEENSSGQTIRIEGEWEFSNNKDEIEITIGNIRLDDWNILRLTNKDLWVEVGQDRFEFSKK
jgi:hypothetical protein